MTISVNTNTAKSRFDAEQIPIAQVFVFKDDRCLGWDCFYKQTIRIGRNPGMDIRLKDAAIAGKHAEVYIKGDKIVVSAKAHELTLRVNDKPVTSAILNALDYITIGPYTLKVKLPQRKAPARSSKRPKNVRPIPAKAKVIEKWQTHAHETHTAPAHSGSNRYRVIFKGDLIDGVDPQRVKTHLCRLLSCTPETVTGFIEKQQTFVKSNLSKEAAQNYVAAFEKAGARCSIEAVQAKPKNETGEDKPHNEALLAATPKTSEPVSSEDKENPESHNDDAAASVHVKQQDRWVDVDLDEEDDVEEEENIQPFLKEELLETVHTQSLGRNKDHVLEIIKCHGDAIVDLKRLVPKEKYNIDLNGKRFRLAAYKSMDACHVFFRASLSGNIKEPGATDRCITDLCTTENIHRKKKEIYTLRLSPGQSFSIEADGYRYHLRLVPRFESPKLSMPAKPKRPFYKSLIKSSGIHVILMVLASLFLSAPEMPGPKDPESRFVKIDTRQLQQPEPEIIKPKPVQPQKLTVPKEKAQPKPRKLPPVAKKKPKKTSPKAQPSSSPNAGGGSDVAGNVKTRHVKETGLLGLLGDGIGLAPKEALAAVTNMDVVASPGASDKNFKIGGIAGKIPGSKLEIVTGDVVRAKGTRQVLRSAGIQGDGEVAALKKGQTGQNKVMAMVSVELDKSVRVQGGMSREAVKRVIDQHLDEISYCYENALIDEPSLMGNIVFEWKILMSGKVGAVRIKSSTIRSGQIHQCIQAAIKSWQFSKPQHTEVMVSYPFVFDIVGF